MIKSIIIFFSVLIFFLTCLKPIYPHGATGETSRAQVGESFAVIAIDPQKGFRLGDAASQRMKIVAKDFSGSGNFTIPRKALVWMKGLPFVFRIRDGWIDRVSVQVLQALERSVLIQSSELSSGNKVVVSGAPLLRVTEMDLNSGKGELEEKHLEESEPSHPEEDHDSHKHRGEQGGHHHD